MTQRSGDDRMRLLHFCLLLFAGPVWALGPHEVLLLINAQSADSIEVGKAYAAMRQIPDENVVRLAVPADVLANETLSADEFARLIWNPATRESRSRGIDGHILAWVYSVDFPTRIDTHPSISLLGLTFLRNQLPVPGEVEAGQYASPLFAGVMGARDKPAMPQTFDAYAEWLGRDLPLPAMMLGYTRPPHGNSVATVLACLQRGLEAEGTAPQGDIYFVQTGDIRSTCRSWQQGGAADDLARLGVRAFLTNAEPSRVRGILGLQIGAANVHPDRNTYLPGCMAEHLTSAGAVLDSSDQTKITEWIAAGVTATAGTITEPYAIWSKFPSAHFHYFYASGCTMIESFYQSIRCPLQLLILGDPLAAPWKPRDSLTVAGLEQIGGNEHVELGPHAHSHSGFDYRTFRYYLDGRQMHEGRRFSVDPDAIGAGTHTLRVVGYRTGLVRQQVFMQRTFTVLTDDARP
ncbi:MAG: TIGR03790 family protein [Verrucomicrobia bacterium]|nr:TIGR03790 family protein [Verrucomicrobiota bacterium]